MAELAKSIVAAFVFIRREVSILLVKQSYGHQYWSLPGGVMESGESIEQTAIREVKEETGLDICLDKLIGIYSIPDECGLALTFIGSIVSGELIPNNEVMEATYFSLADLPTNIRDHLRQRVEDFQADLPDVVFRTQ
jgi:8-oxo-dGTP diphosphatase